MQCRADARSAPRARPRARGARGSPRRTRPCRARRCPTCRCRELSEPRAASAVGPYLDRAAPRPRNRPTQQQQVVVGPDLDDLEPALGHALVAHLARPANALEHARRRGRRADRARSADVVRAVRHGSAREVVALDGALEALALRDARDLDLLALLERLDGHAVAHLELAGLVAELHEVAHGRSVGLLQVTELGLGQALLGHRAEPELDRLVAVAIVGADADHGAGAGLEDGHALDAAVLAEDLRHAELLSEQRRHD